jgi:hypothetical protein
MMMGEQRCGKGVIMEIRFGLGELERGINLWNTPNMTVPLKPGRRDAQPGIVRQDWLG